MRAIEPVSDSYKLGGYMGYKHNEVLEEIKKILPCQQGDSYYVIEREKKITREVKEDKCGNPVVLEHSTTTRKKIIEKRWREINDIIREMQHKTIGKRIFLTKKEAEEKLPGYWEDWWG